MQTLKERAQHVMRKGSIEDYENFVQEIANAPTPEPFGYFKAEPFGWTDCAETDDGAIALYTAPPVSDVEPVAYFTGYNNGYPTIAPINSALCMAIGTALYSAPQPPKLSDERILEIYEEAKANWNAQADQCNQWSDLGVDEVVTLVARAVEREILGGAQS